MKPTKHKHLGNPDPICPHCSRLLNTMPGRKKKCPYCANFIYVRTRPADRKRVLVTEADSREVERQWELEHESRELEREYLQSKDEFDELKAALMKKFGREPSDNDVLWGVYNNQRIDHAKKSNWGLYRNSTFRMAQLLLRENKLKPALQMLFEVTYLDANGPSNLGGLSDPQLQKRFLPFDEKTARQAPGILSQIADLIEQLRLSEKEVRQQFDESTSQVYRNLKLPLSPSDAWKQIEGQIPMSDNQSR